MPILGTEKDLQGNGLVFPGTDISVLVGVADWEACEQPRHLLLAEGIAVILILPLVTRHPAVGTPGFLE